MSLKESQAGADLEAFLKEPPEGAKVIEKEGWFWNLLHYLVMIFTFGGNKVFKESYITTIGPWIAVPAGWLAEPQPATKLSVLLHEIEHVKQFKTFGFGNAIIGIPLTAILYLLIPLPFGFAYCRWRMERVAYLKGIQVAKAYGASQETIEYLVSRAVEQLTGPLYGWTWVVKASVLKWFTDRL